MTTSTPVERRRLLARRALLSVSTILAAGFAVVLTSSQATAQAASSTTQGTPAEKYAIAPGGVDMRTGRYVYNQTDLEIGGEGQSNGLKLARTLTQNVPNHANPFGNLSHNWDISITEYRVTRDKGTFSTGNDYRMIVSMGGRSETFDAYYNSGFSQASQGNYATLTWTGDRAASTGVYTMTNDEGKIFTFRQIGGGDCSTVQRCADIAAITEPDGTVYTFNYSATGASDGNYARLTSVVSSRGYAILLEGSGTLVSKACVLNLASAPMPGSGTCPSGVPTSSYGYDAAQRLSTVTDAAAKVSAFGYGSDAGSDTMTFTRPDGTAPWLTNYISLSPDELNIRQPTVVSQKFADGRTYTYNYGTPPTPNAQGTSPIIGGSYTDNLKHTVQIIYGFPTVPGSGPGEPCIHLPCAPVTTDDGSNPIRYQQTSGPAEIDDALGNVTTFDYCDPQAEANLPRGYHNRCYVTLLQSYTDPELGKTTYTYADGRNIGQSRRTAKPGSGLVDSLTSATFNCSLATVKSCDKPLTTTDANGNVTTYTYKPENGEIATETKPADASGVKAVTRYYYDQRYPWLSNGAGGYVRSGAQSWVLGSTKTCRTTATSNDACAGGTADEVVTVYDYGPDAGPNTLLLHGKVVTADGQSLRTCYRYDGQGNKIAETSPRAGLTACP